MLEGIARKWALFVSRDSRSIVPSLAASGSGLLFVAIHVSGVVSSELLLGLGLFSLFVGFHLFERLGLLLLLDEKEGADSPASRRQDSGAFE